MTANTTVISVISEAGFEIEANITEVDISKVKIGNKAEVELDAYGNDESFEAVVVSIDPAEEVIEGVATYKTVLQFLDAGDKIKSGMSADLEIMTNMKENIIAIPQRAVIYRNGDRIVKIMVNGEIMEREVETGVKGSDGKIEILSGINEGDTVITFME